MQSVRWKCLPILSVACFVSALLWLFSEFGAVIFRLTYLKMSEWQGPPAAVQRRWPLRRFNVSTERSGPEDSSVILSFDVWLPAVLSASLRCCCTVVVATAVETTANLPSGVVGARQSVHAYTVPILDQFLAAPERRRGEDGVTGGGVGRKSSDAALSVCCRIYFSRRAAPTQWSA